VAPAGSSTFARGSAIAVALLAFSCVGVIDGPSQGGGNGHADTPTGTSGTGSTVAEPTPDAEGNLHYVAPELEPAALQARTWKLTHQQYRAAVRDFLGVEVSLVDESGAPLLEPDIDSGVYRNIALSSFVSVALAQDYYAVAEEIAGQLSEAQLLSLSGCATLDAGCRGAFLDTSIQRAFRRPASTEDLSAFGALFDQASAHAVALADPAAGFRAVVRGLLTSPYFLYRTEVGADATQQDFSLTDYEIASLLSFSVLDQPPDAQLLGAASRGELTQPASFGLVLDGLLQTPAARDQLSRFLEEWIDVADFMDPEVVRKDITGFDDARSAMLDETRSFLTAHGGLAGSLSALLTTPLPPAGGLLGTFYASEPSGAQADTTRTGLLALGTVLSTHAKEEATSPTLRGLFVRDRLLCQDFPVPAAVPDISETQARVPPTTTRELYEMHASEPTCAVCHKLIDGLGFTFESLDAVGRPRSLQNGVPIETTGQLLNTDVNKPLNNHSELAEALSRSQWVRECFARQAFRFYFGIASSPERSASGTRERERRGLPPIQGARLALEETGLIGAALRALFSSPSTFTRTRLEPPPAP
jgi:hypothetical protein